MGEECPLNRSKVLQLKKRQRLYYSRLLLTQPKNTLANEVNLLVCHQVGQVVHGSNLPHLFLEILGVYLLWGTSAVPRQLIVLIAAH